MTQEHLAMENAFKEMNRNTVDDDTTKENIIVRFNRAIFLYNIDEVPRQQQAVKDDIPADFSSIIKHSMIENKKTNSHDIIIDILTNSGFKYKKFRERMFRGEGSFIKDFTAIASNIGAISESKHRITDIREKLDSFEEGTLIQINYRTGQVSPVKIPKSNRTINEWAIAFNKKAGPNIHYAPAGLKLR
jgi:hypothetical protein